MSFKKDSFIWPPKPGLLLSNRLGFITSKPRQEWTGEEWRLYAEFLEDRGTYQNLLLIQANSKLGRKKPKAKEVIKPQIDPSLGMIQAYLKSKPRIGRPPKTGNQSSSRYEKPASDAIALRIKIEESGGEITDVEAAKEILINQGYSDWKAKAPSKKIAQQMSRIRTRTKTNLRNSK